MTVTPAWTVSLALLATGAGLCVAAAADVAGRGGDAGGLAAVGVPAVLGGALGHRRARVAGRRDGPPLAGSVLRAVGVAWAAAVAVSTAAYLAVGAFDGLGPSLFESVSGLTTTGITASPAPEELGVGVLAWRALSQWLGAWAILVISASVLPSIGGEIRDIEHPRRGQSAGEWARRVSVAYLGFTVVTGIAYWSTGLTAPDAAAHALTTVSTGGFTTTSAVFTEFGGGTQWVATVAMALAGINLAVLVWGWRGMRRPLHRSVELRAYLAGIGGGTLLLWLGGGGPGGLRTAAFTAASAASTTGYRAVEWAEWDHGAHTVLFILVMVGAMAGSAGGGFRVLRTLAIAGYVRRELVRQLYPHAEGVVRVESTPLGEGAVEQTTGTQLVFLATVTATAMIVVVPAGSIEGAVNAAVAAVSTAGPALADPADTSALAASPAAQAGLITAMLTGRLSLEVLAGAFGVTFRPRRILPSRRLDPRRP